MSNNHTKAPWQLAKRESTIKVLSTTGSTITSLYKTDQGQETEANAKLIAAAPELLEALQYVQSLSGNLRDIAILIGRGNEAYKKIQEVAESLYNYPIAAIKKATL